MIRNAILCLTAALGLAGCATRPPADTTDSNAAPEQVSGAAVSVGMQGYGILLWQNGDTTAFRVLVEEEDFRGELGGKDGLAKRFRVFVADAEATRRWKESREVDFRGQPSLIGEYGYEPAGQFVGAGWALFYPQFPLEPGLNYIAEFVPPRGQRKYHAVFEIPAQEKEPSAFVSAVYPSAEVLPENLLKFYLHFSEPMRQGGVYEFIELVDAKGRKADIPFLEVAEELWDSSGTRLTLLIDPGRVKREVKPLEDLGPAMVAGGTYSLKIDRRWPDAKGAPLKWGFEKRFRVGPPDRTEPDAKQWKLSRPKAGGRQPLLVELGESLDHALLERLLWVEDADGKRVEGKAAVGGQESTWRFTPDAPWGVGDHRLLADEWLEDLAGNRIGRPFEVDIFNQVTERIEAKTVAVSFRVEE